MSLPPKVKAQLDHAETLLQQINAPEVPAAEPQPEAAPVPVDNPVTAQAQEPAAAPTPTPAPAVDHATIEQLEQRYRTLQGIHRSMEQKVRDAQAENAQLRAALEQAAKAKEKPPEPALDPRDSEVFGADLVDMVKRVNSALLGDVMAEFNGRLARIEQQLQGTAKTATDTAENVFLTRLKALVPDYEEINVDPRFLEWLGEEDPVYGTPRQEALNAAAAGMNPDRVAKVFLAFKKSTAPATATAPKPSAKLDKQIAPSSVSTPTPQAPENPTLTVAQVQSFYDDVRLGRYRGRESEQARMEAYINTALAQGRILERAPRYAPV